MRPPGSVDAGRQVEEPVPRVQGREVRETPEHEKLEETRIRWLLVAAAPAADLECRAEPIFRPCIGSGCDVRGIVAEIRGEFAADIETAFNILAFIDLPSIMKGYGPLPAVEGIEDQTGNWDSIGESRIIRLADGSGMLETLTTVDRPRHLAYTISEPTNALRFLVPTFRGSWTLEQSLAPDSTPRVNAIWHYEFLPRSILTWPLAWLIVKRYWQPYMAAAFALASVQVAEAVDRSAR